MERKKTILIAVLLNIGLLAVLFITALATHETEPAPMQQSPSEPLFVAPAAEPPPESLAGALVQMPHEEIVHPLPPLASVELPLPAPLPIVIMSPPSVTEVVVKKGENLDKIARAHQTTVEALIQMNHLKSNFLRIGQKLKIPEPKGGSPKSLALAPPAQGAEYYTVKVGDNPWTIARKHHLDVVELLRLNGMNEEKARKLKPGDRLRIR